MVWSEVINDFVAWAPIDVNATDILSDSDLIYEFVKHRRKLSEVQPFTEQLDFRLITSADAANVLPEVNEEFLRK